MTSRPIQALSGPDFLADMEIVLTEQALALGLGAVLGALLGLLYDIIRPPRRRASRTAAAIIDVVYGLIVGAGVFFYTMAAPGGRLGLWELALILLGFLVYIWLVSDLCYRFTDGVYSFISQMGVKINLKFKKILNMTKFLFHNVQK